MAIGTSVGPLAQGGLDESLGFAIGAWRVDPGEDMPQAPAPASRDERERAKHLSVVGHDAAYPYAQRGIVPRCMVKERRRAGFTLVGEHLGKGDPRTIVNGHERRFPAGAADMIARIAGDAVARALDARQLLAIDVQQLAGSSALVAVRQRCRIQRRQSTQSCPRQHPRDGGAREPQLHRDTGHSPAASAQRKHPLRGAPRNSLRRMVRPRTAIAQAGRSLGLISVHPFTHGLAIGSTALGHRSDCFTGQYRFHHAQSTHGRHWGILVGVHSVLLARTEGVATISFFQLDRGDNVLRLHN